MWKPQENEELMYYSKQKKKFVVVKLKSVHYDDLPYYTIQPPNSDVIQTTFEHLKPIYQNSKKRIGNKAG
jgi:hypothetical protein